MASLGTLTVDLIAKIGGFEDGMDKAGRKAKKTSAEIDKAISTAGKSVAVAFAAMSAAAVAAFAAMNNQIMKVADFQGLAEQIGDTAEAIASIKLASDVSGVSLDTVAKASIKLTKALSTTNDSSDDVTQSIKALGLNFEEFKRLSPVSQIDAVAQAMAGFADGSEKTAIATAMFGKSGAELISIFNDLAGGAKRQNTLTSEQIASADAYNKSVAALKSRLETYAQIVSVNAIPAMTALQNTFEQTILSVLGFGDGVDKLKANQGMTEFAEATVKAFGFIIDSADGVIRIVQIIGAALDGLGKARLNAVNFEFAKSKQDLKDTAKAIDDILMRPTFGGRLAKNLADAKNAAPSVSASRPRLNVSGLAIDSSASKKLADNDVKVLANYISEVSDLMSQRNKFLDMFNSQGLISIKNYYDAQRAILDEGTKDQLAAYDKQIDALKKYQATAFKPTDRADAQGKINDLLDKQIKLQRDAGSSLTEMSIKESLAQKQLEDAISSVNAQLLTFQGNLGAAAAISFDASHEKLVSMFSAEGNQGALNAIKQLRTYTVAQADWNKEAATAEQITGHLQIAEDRIAISRRLGATTELGSLQALGAARQAAVVQMQSVVDSYDAIAKASGSDAMLLNVEKAKVALEQLKATADPVADKFETIFSDSFSDAFAGFIDGTKTATQAFQSFASSVVSQLAKIAAQEVASSLFKGIGGGAGDGGIFSMLGSIFGGGKASGGPVAPNSLYRVNERGPEIFEQGGSQYLMTGSKGGNVIPNSGSGPSIVVNVNGGNAPDVRRAAGQGAREALMAFQAAQRYA